MPKYVFDKPQSSKQKLYKKSLSRLSVFKPKKDDDGYYYLDIKNSPFVLGGIIHPDLNGNEYYRLDSSKKEAYSEANRSLAACTSGGSIRFATDADSISLRIWLRSAIVGMHHFCDRGVFGIDAYVGTGTDRHYVGDRMQTFADSPTYNEGILSLPSGINEVMLNLPLYGGIERIEVGFPKNAFLGAPTSRTNGAIAFYGSSITQGGCVSRPGNAYINLLCRALDSDCVSYGFSGSAMGELAVADHIASRDIACFVMDYDYNAPTVEHLQATHEPFFKYIRQRCPSLPVVFLAHPYYSAPTEDDLCRIEIVKQTYQNALDAGDKNVYFVDSSCYFTPELRDLYACDNLHPNDLGQFNMAQTIYPTVKKALGV